jgi:hypothetical protein
VQAVKEKRGEISEKSARAYFVMTICTAILLFFYMEFAATPLQEPDTTNLRPGLQKEWKLVRPPGPQRPPKQSTDAHSLPAYPWDESDEGLQADLQAARDTLLREPAMGDNELKLLSERVVLPAGKVRLWQLRKHVEEQAEVSVVADRDAWNRHPWITSTGKETKLQLVLLQLQSRSGVKHVIMKNSAGEIAIFLLGPQTSD